jgi:hypothetical protein
MIRIYPHLLGVGKIFFGVGAGTAFSSILKKKAGTFPGEGFGY